MNEPATAAVAEARFFGLRLIGESMLRIVKPGERVADKHSWIGLTAEEYELSEQRLAELSALRFKRSGWDSFVAWLGAK